MRIILSTISHKTELELVSFPDLLWTGAKYRSALTAALPWRENNARVLAPQQQREVISLSALSSHCGISTPPPAAHIYFSSPIIQMYLEMISILQLQFVLSSSAKLTISFSAVRQGRYEQFNSNESKYTRNWIFCIKWMLGSSPTSPPLTPPQL